MKRIGPDLGDFGFKWSRGVIADNGIIYCIPAHSDKVLKIDTVIGDNHGNVSTIEIPLVITDVSNEFDLTKWYSGALSKIDGCIYCMPSCRARKASEYHLVILKIDPYNDCIDCISIGHNLGNEEFKFSGTVADENGIIYGIPHHSKRIMLFDPREPQSMSMVGKEADENFDCVDGVLA